MVVLQFILMILPLVVAVVLHELAHGYVADRLGDPTARLAGRLTLNPLKHLDVFGSFLLPVALKLSGSPVIFGYAKPVPTDPRNFRSRLGVLFVAAAGPFMNLLLAFVFINLYALGVTMEWPMFQGQAAAMFFGFLANINLLLMIFNLIPIGPLDGHYILPYFLPRRLAQIYNYYNDRYGHWLLLALVALALMGVPIFRYVWDFGQVVLQWLILF